VCSVQGRTPLDLLSQELQAYLQAGTQAELFAWGNGANFQLGGCRHAARCEMCETRQPAAWCKGATMSGRSILITLLAHDRHRRHRTGGAAHQAGHAAARWCGGAGGSQVPFCGGHRRGEAADVGLGPRRPAW
jgi:hypothetical protein